VSSVDDVKARLDIVDVVGGYVPLQKAGRYFKANCPFHNERTPSFIVYPDRQSWHCFGACGTGGDVISFVARKESLDFLGALRLLAERAGVELRGGGARRDELQPLFEANDAAVTFYHNLLIAAATPGARTARAYAEERGLDRDTISRFQLGYAPAGWGELRSYLSGRGFDERRLVEVGLLIEGERGPYDRFRDRLIYPIRDDRGRVIGFGGRVLPRPEPSDGPHAERVNDGPKYMNTPQTPIFDKGGTLYGLDAAKDEIRRSGVGVIVEGYMDVIAAHQHDFRNVVASMGTALTDKQAALLRRFCSTVVLAMDADEAGNAATLRGVQVVAAAPSRPTAGRAEAPRPLAVKVAALPRGVDPDEMVRSDPAAWRDLIEGAQPMMEHLYAVHSQGRNLADPADRSAVVSALLPVIAEIPGPVEQAHWVSRLGGGRVGEDALWRQIRGGRTRRPAAPALEAAGGPARRSQGEEFCLALLYTVPDLAGAASSLSEELFSLSENRELFRRWRAGEPVSEEEPDLGDHLQRVLQTRLPALETSDLEAALLDCVRRLEQGRIRAVKEASALALAEGVAGVRPGQVASIARARWEAGTEDETDEDATESAVASMFLDDMEAGLRFHRGLIERSNPDQPETRSTS
jgi:DNA primase